MSKLKQLKEKRSAMFAQIDELRRATDGHAMSAEEQQRWDILLEEYSAADREVEAEERFDAIRRRQLETARQDGPEEQGRDGAVSADGGEDEYRAAFRDYLLHGAGGMNAEKRSLIERRASLAGLSAGVLIPTTLASSIEKGLKSYSGMFEAGTTITTSNGGDLMLPTVNDTTDKAIIVAEYEQSTKRSPSFGSVTLKAYTYRTPIIPVSQELLQDSAFSLDTLDNIMDLAKGVDSAYARNGRFMFNRNTCFAGADSLKKRIVAAIDGLQLQDRRCRFRSSSTDYFPDYNLHGISMTFRII